MQDDPGSDYRFLSALLRFRILHAEGLCCDGFNLLFLHRAVTVIGTHFSDLVYDVHSIDDLTERCILTV